MSLPATDDFTRADAATLGANWTANPTQGTLGITSNAAVAKTNGSFRNSYWTADTFNDDQYSQGTIKNAGGGSGQDSAVTVRNSGDNYYMGYNPASGGLHLYKRVSGSYTSIANLGGSVTTGDVIKITVESTTLKVYKNGVQQGSNQTDAALASGSAGLVALALDNGWEDWEGGNVGGGRTTKNTRAFPLGLEVGMGWRMPA